MHCQVQRLTHILRVVGNEPRIDKAFALNYGIVRPFSMLREGDGEPLCPLRQRIRQRSHFVIRRAELCTQFNMRAQILGERSAL